MADPTPSEMSRTCGIYVLVLGLFVVGLSCIKEAEIVLGPGWKFDVIYRWPNIYGWITLVLTLCGAFCFIRYANRLSDAEKKK